MENEIIEIEATKKLRECSIGRILHKDTVINWNSGGGSCCDAVAKIFERSGGLTQVPGDKCRKGCGREGYKWEKHQRQGFSGRKE